MDNDPLPPWTVPTTEGLDSYRLNPSYHSNRHDHSPLLVLMIRTPAGYAQDICRYLNWMGTTSSVYDYTHHHPPPPLPIMAGPLRPPEEVVIWEVREIPPTTSLPIGSPPASVIFITADPSLDLADAPHRSFFQWKQSDGTVLSRGVPPAMARVLHGLRPAPPRLPAMIIQPPQKDCAEILFSRHGESVFNLEDRIGGDPPLSAQGLADSGKLFDYIMQAQRGYTPSSLAVWTSCLERTIATARPLATEAGFLLEPKRALNEIHAGVCEGLTYREIRERHPDVSQWRKLDKFRYRYPGGESYSDLVVRLEPLLMDLLSVLLLREFSEERQEKKKAVLVVAHQAVLRVFLGYFLHLAAQDTVNMEVPHATVWRVVRGGGGGWAVETIPL